MPIKLWQIILKKKQSVVRRYCTEIKKEKIFTLNTNHDWDNEQEFKFWLKLNTLQKHNLNNVYGMQKKSKNNKNICNLYLVLDILNTTKFQKISTAEKNKKLWKNNKNKNFKSKWKSEFLQSSGSLKARFIKIKKVLRVSSKILMRQQLLRNQIEKYIWL